MGKDKLRRFGEVDKFENVFEFTDFSDMLTHRGNGIKTFLKMIPNPSRTSQWQRRALFQFIRG